MASFLQNLSKPKSNFRNSGEGAVATTSAGAARKRIAYDDEKDYLASFKQVAADAKSAEELLDELLSESAREVSTPSEDGGDAGGEGATLARVTATEDVDGAVRATQQLIVRRKKAEQRAPALIGKRDDRLPWWLSEGKQTTPQVELLVPEARKMLNEILPSNSDVQVDLSTAVKQAVDLAAQMLGGEIRISDKERHVAEGELLSLLSGKGPLQPLYDDPAVTDIFIDSHKSIKVIRRGQAIETPFYFRSKEEYRAYITGMLQSVDRVLNLSSPIVDCALDDEWRSRINAIDSSVIDGDEPRVCIRVPRLQKVSFYDILQTKTLPASLAAWLAELIATGEANILVLGPTGSGKTVMTTALLSAVGSDERIITIEDVPEIFVPSAHLEKLVSRPANAQGQGEISMPKLLRAALRRAPHRIVVGEIRDEEGKLFLRALETGHAGSIATIHAESPKDSLWRLLDVVAAYEAAPQESIMRRIARSLHIVIAMKKVDGRPCLTEIAEVRPPVNGEFVVKSIVSFDSVVDGKRMWRINSAHSKWIDKVRERGLDLKPGPGLLPAKAPDGMSEG